MKANEFRIKNKVLFLDKTVTVEAVTNEIVSVSGHERNRFTAVVLNHNGLKPIELTEDVFNSISYVSSIHLYDCLKRFVIMVEEGDWNFDLKDYPFLHQLQNLYFALTGEELEINL